MVVNREDFQRLADRCRNNRPGRNANIITMETWMRLAEHLAKEFDEFGEPGLSSTRFKQICGYEEVNDRINSFG